MGQRFIEFWNACRSLLGIGNKQSELDEEMSFHIEERTGELVEQGKDGKAARKLALQEFGGVEKYKEECRDSWGTQMLTGMIREFRLGLHLLWKSKGFTAAVVLTLAICLAGNTVVFSILDKMLSPPAYPQPNRVVNLFNIYPGYNEPSNRLGGKNNIATYVDYSRNADLFESLAIVRPREVNISIGDATIRSNGKWVTKRFFDLVGIGPMFGRYFTEDDFLSGDESGFVESIVLAESFWKNEFGGDREILGEVIYLDSKPKTIIGIAPEEVGRNFNKPQFYTHYWNPYNPGYIRERYLNWARGWKGSHEREFLWGRLKEGVSMGQAKAQVDALDQRFFNDANEEMQDKIKKSGHETILATYQQISRANYGRLLYLLQGSVLMVLLIGCLNVANLLVARGFGRKSEFALRAALGGSRFVLIRQMLMECMALALCSCLFGLLLSWSVLSLVNQYLLADLLSDFSTQSLYLNSSSVLFLFGISLAVGLLLGLFSSVSLVYSKRNLLAAIHEGSSQATSSKSMRVIRSSLVSVQVALTVILLIGAGLLIQSFRKAINTAPGIDTKNVYASKLGLSWFPWEEHYSEKTTAFKKQLTTALLEIPGIESVAYSSFLPTIDTEHNSSYTAFQHRTQLTLMGSAMQIEDGLIQAYITFVSPDFFQMFGITLLRGRLFNASDGSKRRSTWIVDRNFVERYYKDIDPIGKHIAWAGNGPGRPETAAEAVAKEGWPWVISDVDVIVGVVENIKHLGLDNSLLPGVSEGHPLIYGLYKTASLGWIFNILIKSDRPFKEVLPLVRDKVRELDPQLPLFLNESMESLVRGTLDDRRAFMLLVTILSAMALILSAIGIYGVLAYEVIQRTREIGLRMALGSTRNGILELFLRQGAVKVVVGLLLGLAGAFVLSSRISDFLFQVEPTEPLAFILVPVFVVVIAFLASYLPARRALRVDPMQALRVE